MRYSVRRVLADERGFTLVELVVVVGIASVLLGAVLTTFSGFERNSQRGQRLSEDQARTREAIEVLARDLRNLASPTPEQPQAVDKAQPYDLVFQTVGPPGAGGGANLSRVMRVRYCMAPEAGQPETLWRQTQNWTSAGTPLVPPTASCPDAWPSTARAAAVRLTNRTASPARPLFQFNNTILTKVTAITVQAWTRVAEGQEPAEGVLRSQVLLRNQNESPVCDFQATANGNLHVQLNGSASYDPEGRDLTFEWFDASRFLGAGIVLDATLTSGGPRNLILRARDPAGLECTVAKQVVVPAT